MAFQDFDHISERRRNENLQKQRKRMIVISILVVVLLLIVSSAAAVAVQKQKKDSNSNPETAKAISKSQKALKAICERTDYKRTCAQSLSNAVPSNGSVFDPRYFIKASISVVEQSLKDAMKQISTMKSKNPQEKGAFEDCEVLLKDANEELNSSVSIAGVQDVKKILSSAPELNNWLSAVMSYQHTCIDGFPEGKLRSAMLSTLKKTTKLTSNALAIVSEMSSIVSTFNIPRHLLASEPNMPSLDQDRLPTWMTGEDRRILKKNDDHPTPNVIVAKDGSGKFTTINDALAAMPEKHQGRYVIYIKEGVYEESVRVTKKMENVTMFGDGSEKTIVSGNKISTSFRTATFVAIGKGFMAKSMGFRNTAGPDKRQAVALRVQSDHAIFHNCRMEGYQQTLYTQTHRQFYHSCFMTGTVDFIYGDAAAIFQNCDIHVRKPQKNQENTITAQRRADKHQTTGTVLQNCQILADEELEHNKSKIKSYLGRPGKEYSRTIVMESEIGNFIEPKGWHSPDDFAIKKLYFAEFKNKGPGAGVAGRVKWPGYQAIDKDEAMKYTVVPFIQGDSWLKRTGVPVHYGLF